ncbi:hypothetical protein RE432_00585 [Pusillimonas sp. SM2304]|uniref:hypothetical protein n=1 Tax=Pusillimonas sp. SM2304 TaxID=3073241 RepID=UPI002876B09A|nr:hypothetical protein [Pusillimonas sp. SM2304]MDS1138913.1 hypothetical protein [Pusillimonas sp. SM2304]
MQKRIGFALMLASCLALASPAFAVIDVQPKVVALHGEPTTVQIINEGDRPEYISITLSRLLNPGVELADEQLEPITQTDNPPLYAYPFRLALAPGQSKTVFLKPLKQVDQEQVYRLDIRPIINLLDPRRQGVSGNVAISLAFSALVRQLPEKEISLLSISCEPEGARLSATGNTRYLVRGASADGRELEPFNVYPAVPILLHGSQIRVPGQQSCSPGGSR